MQFADRVAHVTAVEQSVEMVELLHQRLQRDGVGNCSVLHGDFTETHFRWIARHWHRRQAERAAQDAPPAPPD